MASLGVDETVKRGRRAAFRPVTALRPLAGFFAVGVGLSVVYATTGVGLGCPFRALTGWDCPFCGGTRMGSALLHADVAAAFAFNPVALIAITLLSAIGVLWAVESLGGPSVRLPSGLSERLRRTTLTQALTALVLLAVVDTLLRHLL